MYLGLNTRLGVASVVFAIAATFNTAHAQSFTNTTDGAIGDSTRCGTNTLIRSFNVTGVPTVADLNVGFLANHTWRGDIVATLSSPAPTATTVTLIASDTATSGNDDDYNILMDDSASIAINTGTSDGGHDVTAPLYQHTVQPSNALSAFNGVNGNGTWVLTMCDDFDTEDGTFLEASLFFSSPTDADVSLTASINDPAPDIGDTVTLTITAANAGPITATGLNAQVTLPSGLSFLSSGGTGTFNDATGIWTLPASLASGANTSLTIQATVLAAGGTITIAEVTAATENDPDSTPNNGVTTEDDYDTVSFSPQIGPDGPSLTCPLPEQFVIDWTAPGGAFGWDAADLTNTYTIGSSDYVLTMTGATNRFIARTYNGVSQMTPVTTDQFEGGNTNGDFGVVMNVDYAATSESIITTMALGDSGIGVEEATFGIFDIDNGAWIDEIVVTGTLSGVAVSPTLFSGGSSVSVAGNVGTGVGGSASASGDGNLWVLFDDPIDTVTFTYSNVSPTADPASQVISLQPITMCPRQLADLTAIKSVEVYDPANAGLYMTPGNEVLYKITVTNSATATADADSIDLSDTLPDNVRFVSATTTGFTGGAFGSPALPAANTDCDSGACVIRYSGATLPINTTGEIQVRALIK